MALFVRRRWPKVVAAVAVVLALGAGGWLLLRPDGSGPDAAPAPFATATSEQPGPVDTPPPPAPVAMAALLTATDAELKTYADQAVEAAGVKVLSRVSPSVAWVGEGPATRVLLVLVGTERPFAFAAGARLSFGGAVRLAAPGASAGLGLTGADAAELARKGAYVEIETYTVA
jgi:hypothetical protein